MSNDPQNDGTKQQGSTNPRQKDAPGVTVTPTHTQQQQRNQEPNKDGNSDPGDRETSGGQQAE